MKIESKNVKQELRSQRCTRHGSTSALSLFTLHPSLLRRSAMTLIELLVVIVILTTLVAGVIPILSPNNDARKIREAARGLQTYITMAQAKAARTGRPCGIAFKESSPGSGVALEVYQLEVPPAFAGFSGSSRVAVKTITEDANDGRYLYGLAQPRRAGNKNKRFSPQYDGYQLYELQFQLHGASGTPDHFPPRMIRIGDCIDIEGNVFLVVDHGPDGNQPNQIENINGIEYLVPDINPNLMAPFPGIRCVWLNSSGQVPPQGQKRYNFSRLPINSAEAPYQLPASIAIDMQGSVVEGSSTGGFPTDSSLYLLLPDPLPTPLPAPSTAAVMFSPTGSVSSILFNGQTLTTPSRVALLLGRVENGGLMNESEWYVSDNPRKDDLEELREKINWFSQDSRWLSIAVGSGRVVGSENGFINPSAIYADELDQSNAGVQIEAARKYAHDMKQGGGG